jgi:hypothetical protein
MTAREMLATTPVSNIAPNVNARIHGDWGCKYFVVVLLV